MPRPELAALRASIRDSQTCSRILIVTTKWSQLPKGAEPEGEAREKQLKEPYCSYLVGNGSEVLRFEETEKSARDIVATLLKNYTEQRAVITDFSSQATELRRNLLPLKGEPGAGADTLSAVMQFFMKLFSSGFTGGNRSMA